MVIEPWETPGTPKDLEGEGGGGGWFVFFNYKW